MAPFILRRLGYSLLILLGVYPQPVLDTSAASMHGVQQWFSGALTQLASVR